MSSGRITDEVHAGFLAAVGIAETEACDRITRNISIWSSSVSSEESFTAFFRAQGYDGRADGVVKGVRDCQDG